MIGLILWVLAFIFGIGVVYSVEHKCKHGCFWCFRHPTDYKVDQSNNIAGGDIVGRDKITIKKGKDV